jgi:hypothetical protein
MPQIFLMEVMEWNETLEELKDLEDKAVAQSGVTDLKAELNVQRAELIENTLDNVESNLQQEGNAPPLTEIRRELNAVRYIDRALSEIASIELSLAS